MRLPTKGDDHVEFSPPRRTPRHAPSTGHAGPACAMGLLVSVGLVPAVVAAPAASAATSALTASSPPNFGPVLLGLFGEQNVKVTNSGSTKCRDQRGQDVRVPRLTGVPSRSRRPRPRLPAA